MVNMGVMVAEIFFAEIWDAFLNLTCLSVLSTLAIMISIGVYLICEMYCHKLSKWINSQRETKQTAEKNSVS